MSPPDSARYGRDVGRRRRFQNLSVTNIFNSFISGGSDGSTEPSDGDELIVGNVVMTVKQYVIDSATDIIIDVHAPIAVGQLLFVNITYDSAAGGILRLRHNDSGNQYYVSSGFQNFVNQVASPGSSSSCLSIGASREDGAGGQYYHWSHLVSQGFAFTLN
jgi:hypothetical protein